MNDDAERRFFNCECGLMGGCEKCTPLTSWTQPLTDDDVILFKVKPNDKADYIVDWRDIPYSNVVEGEDEQHD